MRLARDFAVAGELVADTAGVPREVFEQSVQVVLDLVGLFVFGVSGALLGIRKGFDAVGIAVLAVLTAVGGGLLRDVLLGDVPPPALRDVRYLVMPLAAAVVAFFGHRVLERVERAVLVFDAAGLGLFTVSGTLKALAAGLGPLPAVALGVTTGVGGGLLRDIVARDTPVLVRADAELYSVPALAGAVVVVATDVSGRYRPAAGIAAAALVFAFRLLALQRGWRAPRAWQGRRKRT